MVLRVTVYRVTLKADLFYPLEEEGFISFLSFCQGEYCDTVGYFWASTPYKVLLNASTYSILFEFTPLILVGDGNEAAFRLFDDG